MAITSDYVRQIFKSLERGDGADFFTHVADDVEWTVMGTHPLAGDYHSKAAFYRRYFCEAGSGSSGRRSTSRGASYPPGRSGSCRIEFPGDRQERHAVRLAGSSFSRRRESFAFARISTQRWLSACSRKTRLPDSRPLFRLSIEKFACRERMS
jgi:hypothetical protein